MLDLDDPYGEANRMRVTALPPGRTVADVPPRDAPGGRHRAAHGPEGAVRRRVLHEPHRRAGPSSDEGEELLQTLFAALYADDNVYSHHYTDGDLVVWDNLSVQHARSGAVDANPRHLRRLVLRSVEH